MMVTTWIDAYNHVDQFGISLPPTYSLSSLYFGSGVNIAQTFITETYVVIVRHPDIPESSGWIYNISWMYLTLSDIHPYTRMYCSSLGRTVTLVHIRYWPLWQVTQRAKKCSQRIWEKSQLDSACWKT